MNYVLITPVKNEQKYIRKILDSVVSQTILPEAWVIIDGGSTDKTREIIKEYARKYQWIVLQCQLHFSDKGGHTNVSIAMREAYENLCESRISFDYIANIDADQILPVNFFEGIIREMAFDFPVVAASGLVYNPSGKPDTYPSGELSNKRVYRRSALDHIGGYPVTKYSFDSVILAKMRMRSAWEIRTYSQYKIQNLRKDMGIEHTSVIKSNLQWGRSKWYLGYSFPLLVMGCGYLVLKGEIGKSIGVFFGWIGSWISRDEMIADKQIWNHFHNDRLKDILGGIQIEPKHIVIMGIVSGFIIAGMIGWKFL